MKISFEELALGWLESVKGNISKNTYSQYSGYVKNYMLPYFVTEDIEQSVEKVNQNIETYIEKIEWKERAELVKKFYPVFSMILDYAVECGYIHFNYARVAAPFSDKSIVTYKDIGIDELASILAQAKHDEMLPDFVLILDCGLSRGEILGLKWDDIDLEAKTLTVQRLVVARNGTTVIAEADQKRTVSMMETTARLLAERCGENNEFLIPSPSGGTFPFNPSAYRKKIDRVIKKALDGDSVTIEMLGYILSIIKDSSLSFGAVERSEILGLALEKSKDHTFVENKYRKAGTGYVHQISPNCWQGRYTPTVDGKRVSRNVYAATEAECEKELAQLIKSMNNELCKV